MGGYETLETIRGLTTYVVFSQAVEPGDGDPYSRILSRLYSDPSMDGRALSSAMVDEYDASYVGQRPSTTKSAFDMTGYTPFKNALDNLATSLSANLSSMSSTIRFAAIGSQRYDIPVNKDIVNWLDSMSVRVGDAALREKISAVRGALLSSSFRIASKARNGSSPYSMRVERSSGLHIVLPSGIGTDAMSQGGSRTLSEYVLNYPGRAWTEFLKSYVGSTQASQADLGSNPWELYLVWDTVSFNKHSDVDIWVLEPNGNVYIPFIGTVSPNGHLTADSQAARTYYEGYLMNRFVETGRYKIYASLYSDTANVRPVFDVQYRRGYSGPFTSLYSSPFPRLSLQNSWTRDAGATFSKIDAGSYSDLRYAAFLDVGFAAASASQADQTIKAMISEPDVNTGLTMSGVANIAGEPTEELTVLQLRAVKSLLSQRRSGSFRGDAKSSTNNDARLRAPARKELQ
jgi:hypothetical protein